MSLPTLPGPGRRRLYPALAAAVAVLAAAGVFFRDSGLQVSLARAAVAPLVAAVTATGPVEPGERLEVVARVTALLERVLIQEGDQVKLGDPLAVMDQVALQAAVSQAEAEVARLDANLEQLRRRAELGARQAALQVESAETRLRSARSSLTGQQEQLADRVTDAEHALALARLALEGARLTADDLNSARRGLEETERKFQDLVNAGLPPAAESVRSARAAVDRERANLDRLASQQKSHQEQFDRQVAQAEARLTAARDELARAMDPQGQAALQVSQAAGDLEQARVNADLARMLPQEEAAALAALAAARQTLAKAAQDLQVATVRSPLTGVVLQSPLKTGEMAAVGTHLFSLGTVNPVVVKAKVDESDIARVQVGQTARVTSAAIAGKELSGRVRRIAPQAVKDGNATVVVVEVAVDNPDGWLRPGLNADVEIRVAELPEALQVPAGAVTAAPGGGQQVYVLAGNRIQARTVQTGLSTRSAVQILQGLTAGEQVVSGPTATVKKLRPGQRVRGQEAGSP